MDTPSIRKRATRPSAFLEMCFSFTFWYKNLYQSTLQYTFYNHVFDATLLIYGGPRPSNQKSNFSTKFTLGLCVVLIWSLGGHVPLRIEENETRVLYRVALVIAAKEKNVCSFSFFPFPFFL